MEKILYIITQSDWGGAQRYVFDLATNLQKSQDYEICIATGSDGPLLTRLEAQKLAIARLQHLVREISPYHDLMAYFEIKKLLDHIKPDIVHLNSSKAGFLGALAAQSSGIKKIIYTAHGFVFNEPLPFWKKWLYKKIELTSSKRIDKIVCVSEYDRQTGIKAGIRSDKLITIHNGINQDQLNFLPRDEARQFFISKIPNYQNSKLLVSVANFYSTKGLDILVRAMTEIDASLILIGDGPERVNCQKSTVKSQLQDKIIFTRSIPNAATYLKAFDLFVLPSRKEGLPYTLLEAAAAGVPIVATRVGGVPEIIQDGINGYLVEPDNPSDLAATIKKALARPLEPKLSRFDLDYMVRKTKTVYDS